MQARAEAINSLLTTYHDYGLLNGAVLIGEGDDVLFKYGFGSASIAWHVPNAPNTKFRIGSVTKQFTAALVLQLVEEERIDLSAPITKYLPTYPSPQGERVNIHHLLTHTSGIPNYTSLPDFEAVARHPYTPDAFLSVFSQLELEFEPGSQFAYSNSGYFLLGVVIEQVTGQPYEAVLRERLLAPLGLSDTGYDTYSEVVEKLATGYTRAGTGYEHASYVDTSVPYAAGMMYSTVEDLFKWTRALHRGEPFGNAQTLAQMTTPHLNDYAYGLSVFVNPVGEASVRTIAHGGGVPGFSSMAQYLPDEERTVVVLDNTEGNAAAIAHSLTLLLYGQPVKPPKQPIQAVLGEVIEVQGVEAAVTRYHVLKEAEPDAYNFEEVQLSMLGYSYLRRDEFATAVRIAELNAEAYPGSWSVYNSLGEAYLAAKDRERAIESYRRALALHPGSKSTKAALERLGIPTERDVINLPEGVLESYVGRYELQPDFILAVTWEDDHLYVQATGQRRSAIYPLAEAEFYLEAVAAQLTFHHTVAGHVESLTLHQGGQDSLALRVGNPEAEHKTV